MSVSAAKTSLGDTRISGREQRPRSLPPLAGGRTHLSSVPENEDGSAERARRAYFADRERRAASEAERKAALPAYIHACFKNPDRKRTYWVYTWDPSNPGKKTRIPYVCNSWKCEHCQPHAGHVLFSRLQEAWAVKYECPLTGEKLPMTAEGTVFLVLTLDPELHKQARQSLDHVYQEFSGRQNVFMKRLRRWLLRRFGVHFENRWASVTECHRSGVPHVNIALHHPEWAAELREDRVHRLNAGASQFDSIRLERELTHHAQSCGFGWRCTAEANRYGDTEAICGYLVKGVKNADRMHGEIAKLSQIPVMAPKNFRRLRAGKCFIPPKRKGTNTGTVIRRYWTNEGDEQTEPLSQPSFDDPEPNKLTQPDEWQCWHDEQERKRAYLAEVQHCVRIEQEIAWKNEALREPTVSKDKTREELVTTYNRRDDGVTVCGSMVVINVPRSEHGKQQRQDEPRGIGDRGPPGRVGGSDGRANGHGCCPAAGPGVGPKAVRAPLRVRQDAAPDGQLSFDDCGRVRGAG